MGEALLGGLIDGGWDPENLVVAEVSAERRHAIESRFAKVRVVPNPAWAVAEAEVVVVAVKPGDVESALGAAEPVLEPGALVLSIAAGVTIADPEPADLIPSGFWLRPQAFSIHFVWHYMKNHGRARYAIDKALGRFDWQELPDTDLPNHNPGTVDLTAAEPTSAQANGSHGADVETKAEA
jgi:ketopantoate reductase